jgi:hypothetical protein
VDDWRKENLARGEAELRNRQLKAERFGSIAGSATDAASLRRAVDTALAEGLIAPEQANDWLRKPWDEATQAELKQIQTQALTAAQIQEAGIRDLAEQRNKAEEGRKVEEERRKKGLYPLQVEELNRKIAEPPASARPVVESTEEGTFLIDPVTGQSVEAKTPKGEPIRKPKAGGEGTIAQDRLKFSKEEAARKELAEIETAEYGGTDTKGQPTGGLHASRVALAETLRSGKVTDDKGATTDITDSQRKFYKTQFEMQSKTLRQKIQRKYELGAITREQRDQYLADIDAGSSEVQKNLTTAAKANPAATNAWTPQAAPPKTAPASPPISQLMSGAPATAVPAGVAPAAAPPAQPPAPAPAKPAATRIRVKLADGRTGMIDASKFDPKTMTKVD